MQKIMQGEPTLSQGKRKQDRGGDNLGISQNLLPTTLLTSDAFPNLPSPLPPVDLSPQTGINLSSHPKNKKKQPRGKRKAEENENQNNQKGKKQNRGEKEKNRS